MACRMMEAGIKRNRAPQIIIKEAVSSAARGHHHVVRLGGARRRIVA